LTAAALACLTPGASADHTLQDLVSPDGGAPYSWDALHMSQDGQRVLFATQEPFDPSDTDTVPDIYERIGETFTRVAREAGDTSVSHQRRFSLDGSHVFFRPRFSRTQLVPEDRDITVDVYEAHGGTTRLASVGELPSNGLFDATLRGASDDGSRVYFTTAETLVAQDTDGGYVDVYERSPAGTRLVSGGGNGPFDVTFQLASAAGATVVFYTEEQLVVADTDTERDLYANSPAGTELVSTGPVPSSGGFFVGHAISPAGDRVVFSTFSGLVPADTDGRLDIYAREGGTTELISTGPTSTNAPVDVTFDDASEDATVVLFHTTEHLTTGHTWSDFGYYRRAGGATDLIVPVDLNQETIPISSGDGSRAFYETHTKVLPDDTDPSRDIYQWHAGTTTRVSTGPQDTDWRNPTLGGASFDGERVFFRTNARHVPADTSLDWDIYERYQGQTMLLTDNPVPQEGADAWVEAVSRDGIHVLVGTRQSLDPADTDGGTQDAYLYSAPSPLASFSTVERVDDFTRAGQ